jgi:two-component system nitrate/nitrite sensor histidine kinase NarX
MLIDNAHPFSYTKLMQRKSEERPYRRIFQYVSNGIIIHDPQTGLVVEANPAASAIYGYGRQQFIGQPLAAFIHPDRQSLMDDYFQAALAGGDSGVAGAAATVVAVHLRQDGTPFDVEIQTTAFAYQERPCLLSVIRDISQRTRQEQETMAHIREETNQALLQERQRMAQNLHDAVNQSLFSASLIAEVLPRLWERDPDEGRKSLEDLRRLTRGAMAEMRGLLTELRPLVLTDSDLGDLLHQLGEAFTGRTDISVQVTVMGKGSLSAEAQVVFYRVCQEALHNIAKHAWANRVDIYLRYGAGAVTLSIRDNGRGFNPASTPAGHYGLSMMSERAKKIGAVLTVASQPGEGAEITICWQEQPEEGS